MAAIEPEGKARGTQPSAACACFCCSRTRAARSRSPSWRRSSRCRKAPRTASACSCSRASGFLARDVDERSFVVGPALRQLAFETLNHGGVRGLRDEVLAELVANVGETCNFTMLDGAQVRFLDRVEAQWRLRLTLDVGAHVPQHGTASGKLFLAQMPQAARDALIARRSQCTARWREFRSLTRSRS